ncbi:MAG: response regulator [Chloroflexi bacterium]|nr:response regulator [Chloroflexota bacterium]
MSLLLVDDEIPLLESLTLVLQLEGYQVQGATCGRDALTYMAIDPPDLVVLDLSMPDISGWEVLATMRADAELQHIPVVILTANCDDHTRRRVFEHDRTDLITKPADIPELIKVIQQALDGK